MHDLRHTAASLWLGAGADPKAVQRILGHASAAMTMDLYGHLIDDDNLWDAATRVGKSGDRSRTPPPNHKKRKTAAQGDTLLTSENRSEPPVGIEPMRALPSGS